MIKGPYGNTISSSYFRPLHYQLPRGRQVHPGKAVARVEDAHLDTADSCARARAPLNIVALLAACVRACLFVCVSECVSVCGRCAQHVGI